MTATKESNCSHPILAATYRDREWMSKDGNIELLYLTDSWRKKVGSSRKESENENEKIKKKT